MWKREPPAFQLFPNTPNPFHERTKLSFALAQASWVKLEIFNLQGQRVAMPVNEHYAAGRHEAPFVTKNLPNGIYVIRAQAGRFEESRKLVILRRNHLR